MLERIPSTVGRAIHGYRAGLEKIAFNRIDLRAGMGSIDVQSLAFHDHEPIPEKYTADGSGMSPPLEWTNIPAEAASLALIVEDADAPTPQPLVHAIVVKLPPNDGMLEEGVLGTNEVAGDMGRNSYFQASWLPPDPPPGHGTHRYAFQVFALEPGTDFSSTPGRDALLDAIREHGIASGCLIGTYERDDGTGRIKTTEQAVSASRTQSKAPEATMSSDHSDVDEDITRH
jgi:Raf kinase inhibitor-like YbhB/YbcL family protein